MANRKARVFSKALCAEARKLAENGATDEEIAEDLKISVRTFYRYQQKHPEFAEAVKIGKEVPDERIVRSLYKRALGCTVRKQKGIVVEDEALASDGKTKLKVKRVETVWLQEELPPDTTACLAWLNNRRPTEWRRGGDAKGGGGGEKPAEQNVNVRLVLEQRLAAIAPKMIEVEAVEVEPEDGLCVSSAGR